MSVGGRKQKKRLKSTGSQNCGTQRTAGLCNLEGWRGIEAGGVCKCG